MSGFFCISGGINAHANTETEAGNQGDSSASRLHAPRLLRVAVGSGNPSKIKAIERMLERALQRHQCCKPKNDSIQRDPSLQNGETSEKVNDLLTSHQADLFACFKLDVQGFEVESGVPHQPFGDGETKLGARNRSRNAAKAYKAANNGILPHLAIGMEGGLEWHGIVEKSSQSTTLLISSSSRNASDSASNDGGALRSSKNGREASAYPVSTTKELYCMAWMAIYGRRYVWGPSNVSLSINRRHRQQATLRLDYFFFFPKDWIRG
jgi:non-canonical (house-cleaning) NTP pyrophosphatase